MNPTQNEEIAFPIGRLVALISLEHGGILDAAIGPYSGKDCGEIGLFHKMRNNLSSGDVLLADRYFSGYFELCYLISNGIDFVFRQHQKRITDFRKGERLSKCDHLIKLKKPKRRPTMSVEEYDSYPDELEIREVRIHVAPKGFREKNYTIITSMKNCSEVSKEEIGTLYKKRWNIELDLRNIKQTMKMDILRCQSEHMIKNEIYIHLFAYNVIRKVMLDSAIKFNKNPRTLSFKAALQVLNSSYSQLKTASSNERKDFFDQVLCFISTQIVGHRPNRYEPRGIMRRPKATPLIKTSREKARKSLFKKVRCA